MKMFTPLKGALRRTRYEGVELRAGVSKKDFSVQAKIGYVQVCSHLCLSCMYVSIYLSIYLSAHLSIYQSMYICIHQ